MIQDNARYLDSGHFVGNLDLEIGQIRESSFDWENWRIGALVSRKIRNEGLNVFSKKFPVLAKFAHREGCLANRKVDLSLSLVLK